MPSISIILQKDRPNSSGKFPLYFRINHGNDKAYSSLNIWIDAKRWDPTKEIVKPSRTKSDSSEKYNQIINAVKARAHQVLAAIESQNILARVTDSPIKSYSARQIKDQIFQHPAGSNTPDFFQYISRYLGRIEKNAKRYHTFKKHRSVTNKFILFIEKKYSQHRKKIMFSDITVGMVKKYAEYLTEEVGNSGNTAAKDIQELGSIFDHAIKEEYTPPRANPFKLVKVETTKTIKIPLYYDELKALLNIEVKPGSREEKVKDAFLFQIFTGGTRIGDLCTLTWSTIKNDGKILNYTMSKTDNTNELTLVAPARAILKKYEQKDPEKYIFDFLTKPLSGYKNDFELKKEIESVTTRFNNTLKELATRAGINKNLSSHIARHTFAHMAKSAGWDTHAIKTALNHSSVQITEQYLKAFKDNTVDEKMAKLFNTITYAA